MSGTPLIEWALLKEHTCVREGLSFPRIGSIVPKCREKRRDLTRIEEAARYEHYDMAGDATEVAAYKLRFRKQIERQRQDSRVYRQRNRN
jgi:hypothetical protein